MNKPSAKMTKRAEICAIIKEYHDLYPTHGYRWLNAKIKLDKGNSIEMSDPTCFRYCKYLGIRSVSKRCKYTKPGEKNKIFPNLLMNDMSITGPYQVVVSDMTACWINQTYYEITLYLDLFNNEIVSYGISTKKGDRMTYINGLEKLIQNKKEYADLKMILHSDQGSVYSSKSFNELLPLYNITHSMSRAGTPTDNATMESINGWLKEELFNDFKIREQDDPIKAIENYIVFFNEQRPSYALNYLTPKQFKEIYAPK